MYNFRLISSEKELSIFINFAKKLITSLGDINSNMRLSCGCHDSKWVLSAPNGDQFSRFTCFRENNIKKITQFKINLWNIINNKTGFIHKLKYGFKSKVIFDLKNYNKKIVGKYHLYTLLKII